jgi:hypothetical protein
MREVQCILVDNGDVYLNVVEGLSFEEATALTRELEGKLGQKIAGFVIAGEVESHRAPDVRHVHLVEHTRH